MKHTASVFRIQLAMFKRDKGMIVFYLICMAAAGIAIPFFSRSMVASFNIAVFLTVMFLTPILAESLAGEREKKTLESLISTSINGKSIIWGKFLFSLLIAVILFGTTIACTVITYGLAGYKSDFAAWQWVFVIFIAILNFTAISIVGVCTSATSADIRTANIEVSGIAYPLGLLLIVFLSVISQNQPIVTLIVGIAVAVLYFCISIGFIVRISMMTQLKYFENVKIKKSRKAQENHVSNAPSNSHFCIVFRHELKYILKYKILWLNLLWLCFCPAVIILLSKYYLGTVNLNYTVLLTALIMPRTPTNLIAYSIGGEKAYKTGESLLATPLRVRPMFLAKSMIPILSTVIMLALSSLLTLIMANIIGHWYESGAVYLYNATQIVLLFPVGILSCVVMVFITGILSVNMKTPRKGMYASSILGMLFVIPPLMIVYLSSNTLKWSIVYFIILLLCATVLLKSISENIDRDQLMGKL